VIRGPSVSGHDASGPVTVPDPGVSACQHGVGAVDLVAGSAEVLADRDEIGAAGDAVFLKPGCLRLVGEEGAGAGVEAQLGLERPGDGAGVDETYQVLGQDRWLRPGGQADGSRRAPS